jgi:hypothetical protein
MNTQQAIEATPLNDRIELSIQKLLKSKAVEYAILNGRMHNAQTKLNELNAMINSGDPPPWTNKHLKLMCLNAATVADKISLLSMSFHEEMEKRKNTYDLLKLQYNDRTKHILTEILSIGTPFDYQRKPTEIAPSNNIALKARWMDYEKFFKSQHTETLIEFSIRQNKHAKAKAEKLALKKKPTHMEIDPNPEINSLNQKVAALEKKITQLSVKQDTSQTTRSKPKPKQKQRAQTKGKAIAATKRSNGSSRKPKTVKRNDKQQKKN